MRASRDHAPPKPRAKPPHQALTRAPKSSHPPAPNPIWHGLATRNTPQSLYLQAKLKVGAPDDQYEQEADRVADAVMRMPAPNPTEMAEQSPLLGERIQRMCAGCEDEVCRQPMEEEEEELQLKPEAGGQSASGADAAASAVASGGQPLSPAERAYFEPRFGHDFSRVRIHNDPEHTEPLVQALHARAFTLGRNIVFGAGRYKSGTIEGRRLLAHELTHVVQQGRHGRRMLQRAETDTEASCHGLSDTKSQVNQHVNQAIDKARSKSAGQTGQAGTDKLIDETYEQLGEGRATHPGRTKIEDHLETTLIAGRQIRQPAQSSTKYKGVQYILWGGIPVPTLWGALAGARLPIRVLGATLKVDNICIGTDKLGHFFQQGYEYYEIARRKKKGETAAEEYGIKTELGKFGLRTTGVFSNADLEANRQGLAFYDDLAANRDMTFDIATYISNQWNEATNPNYYETALNVADIIWANLLAGSWSGEFTDDRDSRLNVPLQMQLRATPRTKAKDAYGKVNPAILRGTYVYQDASGKDVNGELFGEIFFKEVTVAPGISKTQAVEGVRIKFTWKEGGSTGRGAWISGSESLLQGTWGRGNSTTDGGLWWVMKGTAASSSAKPKAHPKPQPKPRPGSKSEQRGGQQAVEICQSKQGAPVVKPWKQGKDRIVRLPAGIGLEVLCQKSARLADNTKTIWLCVRILDGPEINTVGQLRRIPQYIENCEASTESQPDKCPCPGHW